MSGNLPEPADHAARMEVVRRTAHWHIGDESWADMLIEAYLCDPEVAEAALRLEMDS